MDGHPIIALCTAVGGTVVARIHGTRTEPKNPPVLYRWCPVSMSGFRV